MDNVTHTLFAATLARVALPRAGRGATVALLLASNAPDIDLVAVAGGAISYLQWHRGPTHGPLGIVGLGLATAGLVLAVRKLADRRTRGSRESTEDATFGRLAAVSIAGALFHVLMDLPTSYGTRFLSPFDWHWYAVDWMPIVDVYLWAALVAGLLLARSAAARRRNAAIVLTLMAADYGVRVAAHRRALDVAPRVFGSLLPERCRESVASAPLDRWPHPRPSDEGSAFRRIAPAEAGGHEAASGRSDRCLLEIAATPGFGSPFEWRLIARLSNGYFVRTINLVRVPTGEGAAGRTLVPNVWTPAVIEAARTRPAQVFLGFSRFPAVRLAVDQQGVATVQWTDIRFSGGPDPPRPRNDGRGDLFGARVRIAPDGRILEAQLGGR
jgi:inner membrane protein